MITSSSNMMRTNIRMAMHQPDLDSVCKANHFSVTWRSDAQRLKVHLPSFFRMKCFRRLFALCSLESVSSTLSDRSSSILAVVTSTA